MQFTQSIVLLTMVISINADLSRHKASVLLKKLPKLSCKNKVCLNSGVCLNIGKLAKIRHRVEQCFCKQNFYGPNCGYKYENIEFSKLHDNKFVLNSNLFVLVSAYTLLVVLLTSVCRKFSKFLKDWLKKYQIKPQNVQV